MVSIRNCQSMTIFVLSAQCGSTRRMTKRSFARHSASSQPLDSSPWASAALPPLSRKDARDFWWGHTGWKKKEHTHTQKNLTPKFIMQRCKSHHLCNQTCETSANEQLVCVCVAGAVQSQSCYQILTAEPSDCSSGPVCVMHKYSITLRLASFSPDLPDYLKPGTLFPFVLLK